MRKRINLLLIVLFISIGFAVLTANLNIDGTVAFRDNTWDVYFENVTLEDNSLEAESIDIDNKLTINFTSASFTRPGDYFEFYVDIVNAGSMDATLSEVTKTNLTEEFSPYLNYSVTYYDDSSINTGDLLRAGLKNRLKVRVEYNYESDYVKLPKLDLSLSLDYVKTDVQDGAYNKNIWNISFTGKEQVFVVPKNGTYRLETWGAQGGSYNSYIGGYGGYSSGNLTLNKNDNLYINVGGKGLEVLSNVTQTYPTGGYNGGGNSGGYSSGVNHYSGGGGGATHIAFSSGLLSTFSGKLDDLIIVSGGGGGNGYAAGGTCVNSTVIASGGGQKGLSGVFNSNYFANNGSSGGQNDGSAFGLGQSCANNGLCDGGGGGYYGGYAGFMSAGGGSGYIGNKKLKNKVMYCYKCEPSNDTEIKTIATESVSKDAKSQYAKIGNGYVRITFLNS